MVTCGDATAPKPPFLCVFGSQILVCLNLLGCCSTLKPCWEPLLAIYNRTLGTTAGEKLLWRSKIWRSSSNELTEYHIVYCHCATTVSFQLVPNTMCHVPCSLWLQRSSLPWSWNQWDPLHSTNYTYQAHCGILLLFWDYYWGWGWKSFPAFAFICVARHFFAVPRKLTRVLNKTFHSSVIMKHSNMCTPHKCKGRLGHKNSSSTNENRKK